MEVSEGETAESMQQGFALQVWFCRRVLILWRLPLPEFDIDKKSLPLRYFSFTYHVEDSEQQSKHRGRHDWRGREFPVTSVSSISGQKRTTTSNDSIVVRIWPALLFDRQEDWSEHLLKQQENPVHCQCFCLSDCCWNSFIYFFINSSTISRPSSWEASFRCHRDSKVSTPLRHIPISTRFSRIHKTFLRRKWVLVFRPLWWCHPHPHHHPTLLVSMMMISFVSPYKIFPSSYPCCLKPWHIERSMILHQVPLRIPSVDCFGTCLVVIVPQLNDSLTQNHSSLQLSPTGWKPYAYSNPSKSYTRNLISSTDQFSLLTVCWNPQQESPIHNHPCDGCWLTVLEGSIREWRYNSTNLECVENVLYRSKEHSYITDRMGYHKVGNPGRNMAVTLHLYSPPVTECSVWNASGERSRAVLQNDSEYGCKVL